MALDDSQRGTRGPGAGRPGRSGRGPRQCKAAPPSASGSACSASPPTTPPLPPGPPSTPGRLDRAERHLDRALYLAGHGQGPGRRTAGLELVRDARPPAATAHPSRGRRISGAGHRRSPVAIRCSPPSPTPVRPIGHSNLGDRQAALRSLGYAQEALGKAPPEEPRPSWIAFYGPAELCALTAIVRDRIGDPAVAEAASHQALSGIPRPVPPQPRHGHGPAGAGPAAPARHRPGVRHRRDRLRADGRRPHPRPDALRYWATSTATSSPSRRTPPSHESGATATEPNGAEHDDGRRSGHPPLHARGPARDPADPARRARRRLRRPDGRRLQPALPLVRGPLGRQPGLLLRDRLRRRRAGGLRVRRPRQPRPRMVARTPGPRTGETAPSPTPSWLFARSGARPAPPRG